MNSAPAGELEERSTRLLHQLDGRQSEAAPIFIGTHIEAGLHGFAMLSMAAELREHGDLVAPAERREFLAIARSSGDTTSDELVREALDPIPDHG